MARSFNGTSDLITIASVTAIPDTRTAFTWAGWVNAAAQATKTFVSQGQTASTRSFLFFGTSSVSPNNTIRVLLVDSGNINQINSTAGTAVVLDSTWHHVALTVDSSGNWTSYADGVVDKSGTTTSATVNTTTAGLGALIRSTTIDFLSGSLQGWARWSRALSAGEIKSLAAGLPASHLGPTNYWPLWGKDSPEPDIGNG